MNEEKVTLGAVTENSVEKSGPVGETFIYVDISSIDRDRKVISEPKTLATAEAPSRAKQVLQSGDVLVSMTRPNLNQVAIVTPEYHGAIGSTGFHVLRSQWAEPKFLFYLVQSNDFIDEMCNCVQGALYPAVRPKDISSFAFFLPSSLAQQRIVAEIEKQFSRLDEAVANLKRVKANLKRYKAAVLKAAVEGKLTEEWRKQHPDVEPADKLLERILAERRKAAGKGKGKCKEPVAPDTSGLPELPAGWVVASLEQITSAERVICYGILMPKENIPDGIPYVKVKDMKGDKIDILGLHRTTPKIAEEYKRASLKAGDILLSIRGTYGRVAEVPPELEGGNITQDTARLVVLPPIARDFVSLQLRANDMQMYFKSVARGVAVKGVNIGDIRPAPFFLPPIAEQHQIVAEVEHRLSIVAGAEAQVDANLRRADRLRQSILKQAFSGRLVPQDSNDEPADVLLERIRTAQPTQTKEPSAHQRQRRTTAHKSGAPSLQPLPLVAETTATYGEAIAARILAAMQPGRQYARADLVDSLGLTTGQWNAAIQELKRVGKVRQVGERRGARYCR